MNRLSAWMLLPLALAACHAQGSADEAREAASGPQPAATAPVMAARAPAPPVARANLSAYVGHYPYDDVGGVSFLDQPAVRAAVTAATRERSVRAAVLGGEGPQTPIVRRGGRLLSWGCEAHDCGDHNWTLFVAADGSDPEICYHDAAGAGTRWFKAGAVEAGRSEDCPSGDAN